MPNVYDDPTILKNLEILGGLPATHFIGLNTVTGLFYSEAPGIQTAVRRTSNEQSITHQPTRQAILDLFRYAIDRYKDQRAVQATAGGTRAINRTDIRDALTGLDTLLASYRSRHIPLVRDKSDQIELVTELIAQCRPVSLGIGDKALNLWAAFATECTFKMSQTTFTLDAVKEGACRAFVYDWFRRKHKGKNSYGASGKAVAAQTNFDDFAHIGRIDRKYHRLVERLQVDYGGQMGRDARIRGTILDREDEEMLGEVLAESYPRFRGMESRSVDKGCQPFSKVAMVALSLPTDGETYFGALLKASAVDFETGFADHHFEGYREVSIMEAIEDKVRRSPYYIWSIKCIHEGTKAPGGHSIGIDLSTRGKIHIFDPNFGEFLFDLDTPRLTAFFNRLYSDYLPLRFLLFNLINVIW